ncbi:hypothetical protein QQ054_24130 [Oscillatoria amoena NRMC-F 0135]|nr:hypothetical protein [Oscillatoria laete-virens]MDL5049106.1 hypothetical protein [Oscillatoria amoena NRMC-F 0135]MDL5054010.1 hypothetical protein [Oscillatoria laete-virens NRMC-F 0139]
MPAKKSSRSTRKPAPQTKSSCDTDVVADKVINFIDEAAGVLKKGVRESAAQSVVARKNARRKALTLLSKATKHLSQALDDGASALRKGITKL